MIEHAPWRGSAYNDGIEGQRIAIIGYSHHDEHPEQDFPGYTLQTVSDVVEQRGKAQDLVFFTRVQSYFAGHTTKQFWNRVLFFNFVPDTIGTDRFNSASEDQIRRGRERFKRILDEHRPQKALVFSTKGWKQLCIEQKPAFGPIPIRMSDHESKPVHGIYQSPAGSVPVYPLRHPHYAIKEVMAKQAAEILEHRFRSE